MERKIGEVFEAEDGAILVVEEQSECDGCYYYNNENCTDTSCIGGYCSDTLREDKKYVIFKLKDYTR